MARLMSDAEIRRRKKAQGHISQTTGALGLASLGAFAASKAPGAKVLTKTPRLRRIGASGAMNRINPKKAEQAALGLSTAGAGIGGAGSFNFAAYTAAEGRKRKPVVKRMDMEMGHYGEQGTPVSPTEIEALVEKAWSPSASNFDSERSRQKRGKAYESGALVGAGAGGAYAAQQGARAVHEGRNIKPITAARVTRETDKKGVTSLRAKPTENFKVIPTKALAQTAKHGGKAALGVGAVGAAAGIHGALKRKRKSSWQPYAKRAVSAFGIDHRH